MDTHAKWRDLLPASLHTARLALRTFKPADAPSLAALWGADAEQLRQWSSSDPANIVSAGEVRASIARWDEWLARGDALVLGIFLADELIGDVELTLVGEGIGELGYWVAAPHIGRGLATEAAAALARVAFAAGVVDHLAVRCPTAHAASIRVANHLGCRFTSEGDLVVGELDERALLDTPAGAGVLRACDGEGRPFVAAGRDPRAAWTALHRALVEHFGASLPFEVSPVEAAGELSLVLCAPIAHERAFAPIDLLRHNATLAVGAICLTGETYYLRLVTPLAGLRIAATVRAADLMAHEARRLRSSLRAGAEPSLFNSYAE